ncbi:MAG: porin family protein [Sulfurovum sp.]|nr:porin family protein [Sulfurovum sp.]
MKKTVISALLAAQLMTQLQAGGDIEPVVENEAVETAESPFYIVAKGMMIFGDSVNHGDAVLDGDMDFGYGIDLGYRIGNGFAVEYDFSYSRNRVTEKKPGQEPEEVKGRYYTSALDLVYVYELTEELGVFGKVGYEYEWEKISALDIDSTDHGFVFGVGFEAAMNEDFKFVTEYEHSLIDGPRGDSLFAGVMYSF